MIRIAYIIDTIVCETSGTERQLLETIRRLDRNRFMPYLICLYESEWMRKHELPCQCLVLGYKGFIKFNFPKVLRQLSRLIDSYGFHIVQTFFEDALFLGCMGGLLSNSHPILLSSRRDMGLGINNEPLYHRLFKFFLPLVNKCFAGIITNSNQIKKYVVIKERTKPSKIKVIRNGIDITPYSGPMPKPLLLQKCDIRIGIVASLTPVKRHDVFLAAFAQLKHSLNELMLKAVILGDGPEKNKVIKLAKKLDLYDDVLFLGAVNNVNSYLPFIDIGVLVSDREGLSNAIMEYMAAALPVIATSVGGNIELVDETNGICIPPNDPKALSDAMLSLVRDPLLRKNLGQSSQTKLLQNYSWSKTISQLEKYYHDLIY